MSCAFNPQTVAASGNGAPLATTLTVSTTAGIASLQMLPGPGRIAAGSISWFLSCTIGLVGLMLAGRRKLLGSNRKSAPLLAGIALYILLGALAGCGGSNKRPVTHPPVIATINVTATSGATSHTTSLTLTITH